VPTDEEKAENAEEFGWKLVHADVFRPPTEHPMLLAVLTGTGMQVLLMSLATIFFSAVGFISPAYRGGLVMALLMFFCLCGAAAGYTTARLYKSFKGKLWQRATALTAVLYVRELERAGREGSERNAMGASGRERTMQLAKRK
jgi:transmembrane 9 superfamily protein 2/4